MSSVNSLNFHSIQAALPQPTNTAIRVPSPATAVATTALLAESKAIPTPITGRGTAPINTPVAMPSQALHQIQTQEGQMPVMILHDDFQKIKTLLHQYVLCVSQKDENIPHCLTITSWDKPVTTIMFKENNKCEIIKDKEFEHSEEIQPIINSIINLRKTYTPWAIVAIMKAIYSIGSR